VLGPGHCLGPRRVSEDFDGAAGTDLNNSAPDIRPGSENWVAAPIFNQDGSLDQGPGSAALAFTPVDGTIYTLDASLAGVSGNGDWFALGFGNGQSTGSTLDDRFITGNVVGTAWMLIRGNASGSSNTAFLGTGASPNGGTADGVAWTAFASENPGGDMDLRIVLDTTGGPGAWSATWFAKRPAEASYTEVRSATPMPAEAMSSVGLAVSNAGVFGTIESFTLSDNSGSATGPISPYAADANTRHLWHFDESGPGPAQPASGVSGSFSLAPGDGAVLGATSFAGLGSAGDSSAATPTGFQGSSIPVSNVTGPDGAFTFEAIIRTTETAAIQQIISMENSGGATDRPFQFRIDAGNLRFINISGGVQQIPAAIPTTGPDAFVPNEWFHAAVTYNGTENTPDNLKLYWTRVDASRSEANEILSTTMVSDLGGTVTVFGVANEYRGTQDNNLRGRIDEVRISDIARAADGFLFLAPDTDNDGLGDPWEILHFRESPGESEAAILAKYDGTDDPDEDTFDNEAEETAGTDPNDSGHTPLDADQDGYQDAWELATFGTISYGPSDDPDGDGWTTAEELTAGTDPANPVSNPDDTDADGLEDAAEIAFFGDLGQGPLDDFDDDGFGNLAELEAGTDPTAPDDFPLVSFLAVTDANANTDENGYAGSAINVVSFCRDNLQTVGDQQFIAYYRRHATDADHPENQTLAIGRRNLDEAVWEIFPTTFQAFNINDTHDVVSFTIDGDGFLHMSWGMHGNSLLYAKSSASVLGSAPIVMVSLGAAGMTGHESGVTYPMFETLPDGNVLFMFREGSSGNGDTYLNRYDITTDTWAPVHTNGSGTAIPFFKGTGFSPNYNFYPDRISLAADGTIHVAGVVRYNDDSPAGQIGFQTNHRYLYMKSDDDGTTWRRSDGSVIDLPMTEKDEGLPGYGPNNVPEIALDIPEGFSLMNQSGMTTDNAGHPVIANWWSPDSGSGDFTRNYQLLYHDGSNWQQCAISNRTIDDPGTRYSEAYVSHLGRPIVVVDEADRIIVVYRDNRDTNGVTVVWSEPLAQDPTRSHWSRMDLTTEDVGDWEPTYDEGRWKRDGVLHLLYQKCPGNGISYSSQNHSTPVSILEWNARAYFNGPLFWSMDTETNPDMAAFSARTRVGFRYDLRTSTELLFSDPPATSLPGDGSWREFGSWPMSEPRRFWRMERAEEATDDL